MLITSGHTQRTLQAWEGEVEMVPRTVVAVVTVVVAVVTVVVAVVTVRATVAVIAAIFHHATDNSHHPLQRHHGKNITEHPGDQRKHNPFYQHDHPLTKQEKKVCLSMQMLRHMHRNKSLAIGLSSGLILELVIIHTQRTGDAWLCVPYPGRRHNDWCWPCHYGPVGYRRATWRVCLSLLPFKVPLHTPMTPFTYDLLSSVGP